MLSIHRKTVYRHQATIRTVYDVHGNIELMRAILSGVPTTVSQLALTPRGREIFQLILVGKTSKEIAEFFCISYSGVLRHREKCWSKTIVTVWLNLLQNIITCHLIHSLSFPVSEPDMLTEKHTVIITTPEELLPLLMEAVRAVEEERRDNNTLPQGRRLLSPKDVEREFGIHRKCWLNGVPRVSARRIPRSAGVFCMNAR